MESLQIRVSQYHRERYPELKFQKARAKELIIQHLRSGRLIGIDHDGKNAPRGIWQSLNLNSREAVSKYIYPSTRVIQLWRSGPSIRPAQYMVNTWMREHYQNRRNRGDPATKTAFAVVDCRNATGCSTLQATAALRLVPSFLKNRSKNVEQIDSENG